MPKFKDPNTGQVVNVNSFLVFLSCLLFGMFFFLYIGETQHALVMVGFAILIILVAIFIDITAVLFALIFPIIYSFIAPKIVKDKWLNKGYVELEEQPVKPLTPEQEEIEIWSTYVEYGWTTVNQKYPKFVVARIIDRTQKEPQISDYIPQDLRDKIIDKWK